ncbi:MAG: energy transducer TonB [Polyangiaceae bacterium]
MARSTARVHGLTVAVSVAFHAVLTAGLSYVAYRGIEKQETASAESPPEGTSATGAIHLELPAAGEGYWLDQQPPVPEGEVPRAAGGELVAHLDTGARGRGGEPTSSLRALNLADVDDRMRLSPDPLSRLDRDQLQRLRVARQRASWEDRRSTTHPTELTLVATGPGTVRERRAMAAVAPSRGELESRPANVRGADLGVALPPDADEGDRRHGGAVAGSLDGAPGPGLVEGRPGIDHRSSAPVGSARPDVTRGPVAVAASERALPRDDVDSEQDVATTVRSLVHASTAGGLAGEGLGGSDGRGEAGVGGTRGAGSHARPMGDGDGDVFDYWTSDPRLVPYFRRIHARVDPLWVNAFPKSAMYDLKQGTVILEFTVSADGSAVVSWPPVRPSGVDEFDRNCADAVRRAAPFSPIPPELGMRSLRIRAPFVASNPVVK